MSGMLKRSMKSVKLHAKARLAKMRAHHATGHRWDVAKGQWIDE
jgi:hypothetical protein